MEARVTMENKNDNLNNEEFSFVQEKIVPKKKRKIRKMILITLFTVFLAVLFGLVARVIFIKSGSLFYKLFGMSPPSWEEGDGRKPIGLPSSPPDEMLATITGTPGKPSYVPTEKPTPTITLKPTPIPTVTPTEGKQGKLTPAPNREANLDDYASIMSEMRKQANHVNQSILKVKAVKNDVNWLSENIDITKELSAFIMAENGVELLLLSCYDKVQDADRLEVTIGMNLIVEAKIFDYDSDCNLAVLAVSLEDIPESYHNSLLPVELGDSNLVYPGMPILALGNPNGYNGSMEIGFITSKGSVVYIIDNRLDLFNTDITNTENSDGIIINLSGQVIGIITHTLKEKLNTDISTAIGITKLKPIILQLLNGEDRVYFGIMGEDIPSEVLEEMKLDKGIYVTEVEVNSPAVEAGIKVGDIITMVDDSVIFSMNGFANILSDCIPKDEVQITYYRKIKQQMVENTVIVKLQKKKR